MGAIVEAILVEATIVTTAEVGTTTGMVLTKGAMMDLAAMTVLVAMLVKVMTVKTMTHKRGVNNIVREEKVAKEATRMREVMIVGAMTVAHKKAVIHKLMMVKAVPVATIVDL